MFESQIKLEEQVRVRAAERADMMMRNNEEKGRAGLNPYSRSILRKFVLPLSEAIDTAVNSDRGCRTNHIKLMRGVEPQVAAYIAIRTLIVNMLSPKAHSGKDIANNGRKLMSKIASDIQAEQVMEQFKDLDEVGHFKMMRELQKKAVMDVTARKNYAAECLKVRSVSPIDWGHGNREQVGMFIVSTMAELGMVKIERRTTSRNKSMMTISLTDDMLEYISDLKELFKEMMPLNVPCIEKPLDWTTNWNGGYHTMAMRKISGPAVTGSLSDDSGIKPVLNTLNTLQSVRWSINQRVLDVAKRVSLRRDLGEVVGPSDFVKPTKPSFIDGDDADKTLFTPEQALEFSDWKYQMKNWYTDVKLRKQARVRMLSVFDIGDQYKNEKEIFYVYSADFRGRVYPRGIGPNPQGSDLQKACLHFSEGKKIRTKEAEKWFLVHGANKSGNDKLTLEERVKWVRDNSDMILAVAEDPENNDWWMDTDCPFQFLAWCFEYADYAKYGCGFLESRLPISMDGSCNGLQNFSAAFLDKVGAEATNLTPGNTPKDIYTQVADVTLAALKAMPEDPAGFRSAWIKHGVKRGMVKRSVMTLPYGSTRYSSSEFILKDYIIPTQPVEFKKEDHAKAAQFLSIVLWDSIGKVVIKAREAMTWLQKCADIIIASGHDVTWKTPNGFWVKQDYKDLEMQHGQLEINTYGVKFRMYMKEKGQSKRMNRNGVAPNWIHSIDASHMQRVTEKAAAEGIHSMAMIHDDFGTHAADAERFNQIIREAFVEMYQAGDWAQQFYQHYQDLGVELPEPPAKGTLDINLVLQSRYFFS